MCTRAEMREIVREVRPDYHRDEIESAVGICMEKCGMYVEEKKIREEVERILKVEYANSRGYDLKKNFYSLLNV